MVDVFQLFKDKWSGPALVFYEFDKQKLTKLNNEWYWIYKAANDFDATQEEMDALAIEKNKKSVSKRNTEFLKRLRFVYADIDFAKEGDGQTQEEIDAKKNRMMLELMLHLEPTKVIKTKNWLQPLWEINEDKVDKDTQERYVNCINGIIERSRQHGWAWDAVKDCARVLRVPWFNHMKWEPFPITFENMWWGVYTLDEVIEAFPYNPPEKPSPQVKSSSTHRWSNSFDNDRLQKSEVDKIDIRDIVVAAYASRWQTCTFNWHVIVLDGKPSGNFIGKNNDWQYVWSSSHDPSDWNKITSVSKIRGGTYSDSWKRIIDTFNIPSESELKKRAAPKVKPKAPAPTESLIFDEKINKTFSLGNRWMDVTQGDFWEHDLVLFHWPSWSGKTSHTVTIADTNGKSIEEWWRGHKVAYFSLEMSIRSLKMQQWALRTWLDRRQFQKQEYNAIQRQEYLDHGNGFDDHFTLFDKQSFWDDWPNLESICANIEKLHLEDWYCFFIIDSLKLIKSWDSNEVHSQSAAIKALADLKNKFPICILLIHHNNKSWDDFSWSQDLENFCDRRISIRREEDPIVEDDDDIVISVLKERFGWLNEYRFKYRSGKLKLSDCKKL